MFFRSGSDHDSGVGFFSGLSWRSARQTLTPGGNSEREAACALPTTSAMVVGSIGLVTTLHWSVLLAVIARGRQPPSDRCFRSRERLGDHLLVLLRRLKVRTHRRPPICFQARTRAANDNDSRAVSGASTTSRLDLLNRSRTDGNPMAIVSDLARF